MHSKKSHDFVWERKKKKMGKMGLAGTLGFTFYGVFLLGGGVQNLGAISTG